MALFTALTATLTTFLGSTALAGTIASFIVTTASNVLTSALVGLIIGPEKAPAFSVSGKVLVGETVPRGFPLGKCLAQPSLVYGNEWAMPGGSPNTYLTLVFALSDVPVKGLLRVMVNGAWCTLGGTAVAQGYPVTEFTDAGTGRDYLWVKFYDGTQTAADTFLTGTVADARYPYQSTRVGYGVAYAIVTARLNDEMFTAIPEVAYEIDGIKLYDPSRDTSVGGAGSQRWATPSTWGGDGDYLPVVQAYNVMRGVSYSGQWFYGFQGVTEGRLPSDAWITAIGDCRATVTTPGGTEPRFRAGGFLTADTANAVALEALMAACAGRIADLGGIYKPTTGVPGSSVRHLDKDKIITDLSQAFMPIKRQDELTNAISAAYPNPEDGYAIKKSPLTTDATLEAKHGGRRAQELTLYNVPFKYQVQRLQKMATKEVLRARRHTFTVGPDWWDIECDQITYTDAEHGYSAKKFRIDAVTDLADGNVALSITEHDSTDYDLDAWAGYASVTNAVSLMEPRTFAAQSVPGFDSLPVTILDGTGRSRISAIKLIWDSSLMDGAEGVEWQIRDATTLADVGRDVTANLAADQVIVSAGILPSTAYEARARLKVDRAKTWTAWDAVTSPAAYVITPDLAENAASVPVRAISPAVIDIGASWTKLISATIKREGYPTDVQFSTILNGFNVDAWSANSFFVKLRIVRAGTVIWTASILQASSKDTLLTNIITDLDLGTGNTIYKLEALENHDGLVATTSTLMLTQMKR